MSPPGTRGRALLVILSLSLWGCTGTIEPARDSGVHADAAADSGGVDAGPADAGPADSGPADAGLELDAAAPTDAAVAPDAAPMMDAGVVDAGVERDAGAPPDGGPMPPAPTPVVLTPTYFGADASTTRGASVWATESYPEAVVPNARTLVFWGRFADGGCAPPGWGATREHPLSLLGLPVFRAVYPDCAGSYGPSVDADTFAFGAAQHLIRTAVAPGGAFRDYGMAGQNASGANAYIHATYVGFNPRWTSDEPNRMRPWSGSSADPARIRFALRARQSVVREELSVPTEQQLQQVLRMLVINEDCDRAASSSFCQLEFNFKTFNRGVGAYTDFSAGSAFNDAGQGGLIAVVGPIAATGQSTTVHGDPAWTSWGASTQLAAFDDETFQIEMTWDQFQQLLRNVSEGNPAAIFGANWQVRDSWVLLRIGYGHENYNRAATGTSVLEGYFESVEVLAL